jgi:hypothetical protein
MNFNEDRLDGTVQDNVLCVLCFDEKWAKVARGALTVRHFENSVLREIAGIAIDYLDKFGVPVGDHLPDYLEDILKGDDTRKANSYRNVVTELMAAHESKSINGEFVVIGQLHKFVRQQTIKSTVKTIVECMEDGRIDDAEVAMEKGLRAGVSVFNPGLNLRDPKQALRFLEQPDKPYRMGVEALDRFDIGPAPKTLMLMLGATNKGKSWGLIHVGKHCMIQRKSVAHLTLELSEDKTMGRYMQSIFSISRKQGLVKVPRFNKGFDGSIRSVEFDELNPPSTQDDDIHEYLERRITRRLKYNVPFAVKSFAAGSLTIAGLNAWLDGLERHEGWTPDVIIIDVAENMALDAKDLRGSIGRLFVQLRGVADERNAALVTGSQVNRAGMDKQTITSTDMAEDISKAFTADVVLSYNQTAIEQKMGLARLHVAKNRDGEVGMTALITQSYPMGQFCIDSMLMSDSYLPSLRPKHDDEDDDSGARRR